ALRRAARAALAQPRAASWTLLALTCALAAAGIAVLAANNIESWTSTPRGGASMVVYLGERVDEARARGLAGELGKLPGVERAVRGTPGVDDVVVDDGGSDRLAGTLSVVRVVAWTGAALLGGLALVIVLAAVRSRLDRGARERRVLQLLGASPGFTIVPTALA